MDLCEFKVHLVYRVSFRTDRLQSCTEKPCLEKKEKKGRKKEKKRKEKKNHKLSGVAVEACNRRIQHSGSRGREEV